MIYYFSGASCQKIKLEMNVDQLFSAYHERRLVKNLIKYKSEHPEHTGRIMLDSGAFSQYMNLKKKGHIMTEQEVYDYTDDYLKYLDEVGDHLTCFVAVDSVPDPDNVDADYARRTWENYLYMYERIRPENRDKLIPVFHYGEDFKWLKKYLELRHEDGSKLAYLGLAISLEGAKNVRIKWGQECEKIIAASSNPNVQTHAFGVGVKDVLDHLHVTSTDATSWIKRAAFGMVAIKDKPIVVSDVRRQLMKEAHYDFRSTAYQDAVKETIARRGFTVNEIENSNTARAKFNIMDTLEWVEEFNKTHEDSSKKKHKAILW